mgnify:CR=1 FL=1
MRCLVTGASGLVGGRLARLLVARRHTVRCLVRSHSRTDHLSCLPIEYVRGDVTQPESLAAAVDGVDWVFHAAGLIKARDADEFRRINAGGTGNLLEACARRERPPEAVVVVSSLAAAGPSRDGHPVSEDERPRPISSYGRSKLEAERIAETYGDRLRVAIIRPPAVYGPGDRETLALFRIAALGIAPRLVSRQDLSLVHVDDLARGLIAAAERAPACTRVYNIAHPEVIPIAELTRLMAESVGRAPVVVPVPRSAMLLIAAAFDLDKRLRGKTHVFDSEKPLDFAQRGWVCSTDRAREELGFEAVIDVRRGIAETGAWYRENGWL